MQKVSPGERKELLCEVMLSIENFEKAESLQLCSLPFGYKNAHGLDLLELYVANCVGDINLQLVKKMMLFGCRLEIGQVK
jgi:hypothetical protein